MRANTDTVKKSLATPMLCGWTSAPVGKAPTKSAVWRKYFTARCATTARAWSTSIPATAASTSAGAVFTFTAVGRGNAVT